MLSLHEDCEGCDGLRGGLWKGLVFAFSVLCATEPDWSGLSEYLHARMYVLGRYVGAHSSCLNRGPGLSFVHVKVSKYYLYLFETPGKAGMPRAPGCSANSSRLACP